MYAGRLVTTTAIRNTHTSMWFPCARAKIAPSSAPLQFLNGKRQLFVYEGGTSPPPLFSDFDERWLQNVLQYRCVGIHLLH